jgi:hypothetical protein
MDRSVINEDAASPSRIETPEQPLPAIGLLSKAEYLEGMRELAKRHPETDVYLGDIGDEELKYIYEITLARTKELEEMKTMRNTCAITLGLAWLVCVKYDIEIDFHPFQEFENITRIKTKLELTQYMMKQILRVASKLRETSMTEDLEKLIKRLDHNPN